MPDQQTAPADTAAPSEPPRFREGFYAIHYDGPAGKGVLLACLKDGQIVGADMGGGMLEGSYHLHEGDIVAECVFHFSAGQRLVTGQTLPDAVQQRKKLVISLQMFEGQRCRTDIGFGPVNGRGLFVAPPL